jgi:hypothetical protein
MVQTSKALSIRQIKTIRAMKKINILKTPPEDSMMLTDFGTVDYCDSYRITKTTDDSAKQIVARLFHLPKWINGLMILRHWMVKPFGLKTEKETNPNKIFPIIAQNENEIIMGINDRHLNFRVSVLTDSEKSYIFTTTLVHYNNGWGKVYFLLVRPFHKIIVCSQMRRLLKD